MDERRRQDAKLILRLGVEAHRYDFFLRFDSGLGHLNKFFLIEVED